MREIIIPNPIQVGADDAKKEFSFFDFLKALLLSDRRFNATMKGALAAERIAKAADNILANKDLNAVFHNEAREAYARPLVIESTDGDLLRDVCAEPTDGYPIRPAYMIVAMLRAVAEQKEI